MSSFDLRDLDALDDFGNLEHLLYVKSNLTNMTRGARGKKQKVNSAKNVISYIGRLNNIARIYSKKNPMNIESNALNDNELVNVFNNTKSSLRGKKSKKKIIRGVKDITSMLLNDSVFDFFGEGSAQTFLGLSDNDSDIEVFVRSPNTSNSPSIEIDSDIEVFVRSPNTSNSPSIEIIRGSTADGSVNVDEEMFDAARRINALHPGALEGKALHPNLTPNITFAGKVPPPIEQQSQAAQKRAIPSITAQKRSKRAAVKKSKREAQALAEKERKENAKRRGFRLEPKM